MKTQSVLQTTIFDVLTLVIGGGLVGDTFERLVFVTLGLSDTVVFGLLNADERRVDVAGADLTREAAVVVAVLVAVSFDAVVLVAGLVNGL